MSVNRKRWKAARSAVVTDIRRIDPVNRTVGPVLVEFEHARVRPEAFEKLDPKLSTSFVRPGSESNRGRQLRMDLSYEIDDITYTNEHVAQPRHQLLDTYMAIVDTVDKSIKLVQVASTECRPILEAPPSTNPFLGQEELSEVEKRRQLVANFGQEKSRRLFEQGERLKVETSAMKTALYDVALNVDESKLEIEDFKKLTAMPRPPRNESAVTPEEVYTLDSMVNADLKRELESAVTNIINEYSSKEQLIEDVESTEKFSKLFSSILEGVVENRRGFNSDKLAGALLMEGLIHFIKVKAKAIRPKQLPDFLPKKIKHYIIDTFCLHGLVGQIQKDLAISYVIALGLMACNFQLSVELVLASLRRLVTLDKLKMHSSVVGSTWTKETASGKLWMVLKLPLPQYDNIKRKRRLLQ